MIKYKILNMLFGWDYVVWKPFLVSGVSRIHQEKGTGRVYYFQQHNKAYEIVTSKNQVVWLTCSPEKYGFE